MHGLSPALPAFISRNPLLSNVFFYGFHCHVYLHTGNGWNVKYLPLNAVVHDQGDGAVYHISNYLIHGLYV
jgi:hypothetical protein